MTVRRKIGELQTKTAHFVIYFEADKKNPYRIVRKYWDGGTRTKTVERYGDLLSVTIWLNNFVLREAGHTGIFTTEIF